MAATGHATPCRPYPALAANLALTRKHTARTGSFLAVPRHRTRASIAPAHHIPRHSAAQLDRAGHADKSIRVAAPRGPAMTRPRRLRRWRHCPRGRA